MFAATGLAYLSLSVAKEPLTPIADNTTAVPGAGVPFDSFSAPRAAGTRVSFTGSGGGGNGPGGVYITDMAAVSKGNDPPAIAPVFSVGDPFPGGGKINQTGDVALCTDGTVAFFAASKPVKCWPGWGCSGALLVSHPVDSSPVSARHLEVAVSIGSPAPGGDGKLVAFEFSAGPTAAGTALSGLHLVFVGLTDTGMKIMYRASKAGQQRRRLDETPGPGGGWTLTKLLTNSSAMPHPDEKMRFVDIATGEGGAPISMDGDRVVFFGGNRKGIMHPDMRDGIYEWTDKAGVQYVASSNHTAVPGKDDAFHFIGFGSASLAQNTAGESVICFMAEAGDEKSPPIVGIWCQHKSVLVYIVGSTSVIPDSPEPTSPHNLFQYVDYPSVSIGKDGLSYMVVFQGNDGLGRRGVYRALAPEQLETVTDWQDSVMPKQGGVFNIQLNTPSFTGGTVAIWLGFKSGNEGIFATSA